MLKVRRLRKLKIGKVAKLRPLDSVTKGVLRASAHSYEQALRKGQEYRKTSRRKWGGSAAPMNP